MWRWGFDVDDDKKLGGKSRKKRPSKAVWSDMDDEATTTLLRDLATRVAAAIPEARLKVATAGFAFFLYENGEAIFWTNAPDNSELGQMLRRFLDEIRS
jgi:hypothetical protein